MKIGIFDSGLGGLVIAKAIFMKLPKYDYIYLGDTKNLPYGNRSKVEVYKFTKDAVRYLFEHNCQLVILACNTASALALRKIQREFLAKHYPERRVLGVVIPTLENVGSMARVTLAIGRVGILSTKATAKSHVYKKELKKINPYIKIFEQEAPLLVPLIEQNALQFSENALKSYMKPLLKNKVEAIVLACTHYPILSGQIKKIAGKNIKIVSQTEFLPAKLKDYLRRHKEIDRVLSKNGKKEFLVTSSSKNFDEVAGRLFGKKLKFKVVGL